MATDENNHKNEARDDWTGCTFRAGAAAQQAARWPLAACQNDPSSGFSTKRWRAGHRAVGNRERGGKVSMRARARPVRRDRIVTILPSEQGRERRRRRAAPASHIIRERASSRPTQVPRRWHRPAAQPASAADQLSARTSWTSSFVLFFPSSTSRRAGRPVGSTPLRVRTAFFRAVMFPLHCYPHIVLLLTPRVVSSLPQRS